MKSDILDVLSNIADELQTEFKRERRVLSFQEYLQLFATDPVCFSRDAARYIRDMFDFYGTVRIERPWGSLLRFKLFDQNFDGQLEATREALSGQESVQAELYRVLNNFVREGRPNRLILLHGPNGSAKSTVAACIMRALEDYSARDAGALYRFHWVFPKQSRLRGAIGFGGRSSDASVDEASYAHLSDDEIDARLLIEVRDHPLFLLPKKRRADLLKELFQRAGADEPPHWVLHGMLSHKSRQVYEALLASYEGCFADVLRHVQVERYFISRRYRVGAVTLGPQLSVDAGERQVTADRSLGALPSSLQALTLFEAHGELLDAAGGLLEFSDLLKRPLDAFKYLQITAETGEVALRSQNVQINSVMLGSGNEVHLQAFREHPEFGSFRGRLELIRAPYLLSWVDEEAIYKAQIVPQIRTHVAPHATRLAAMFAVLTRMRKPNIERYKGQLKEVVGQLSAVEKMDLYATGATPEHLEEESAKLLRSAIRRIYHESDAYPIYEGSSGASPREMRAVLLDAAQSSKYKYLSPFAVLEELDKLCARTGEYAFLQDDVLAGAYHDHATFRSVLRQRLLDSLEDELRIASGFVDEVRYNELFDRYVTHVNLWVKREKIRNPVTGEYENPDEQLMTEVEALLGSPDSAEQQRHSLINTIAAWAIDHPGEPIDNTKVFRSQLKRMRDAVFHNLRISVAKLCQDMVLELREEGAGLDSERQRAARACIAAMCERFGYERVSVADAVVALTRERFADQLS